MNGLVVWLVPYLVHSTLLLLAAAALGRVLVLAPAARAMLWKAALFGGLFTASVQVALGVAAFGGAVSLGVVPAAPFAEPEVVEVGGPSLALLLFAAWAAIAALLVARQALGWRRLRRQLADRREIAWGPLAESLARLCATARVRIPRLSESAALEVPLAFPGEICLPRRVRALSPEAQEALLAHEVAHLRRGDPLWRVATRALEALLFFQPLNFLALRAFDSAVELACDDEAAALGADRVALARCLVEVAAWRSVPEPRMVPAMTGAGRALRGRVERLVQAVRPPSLVRTRLGVLALAGVASALLLACPTVSYGQQQAQQQKKQKDKAIVLDADDLAEGIEDALDSVSDVLKSLPKTIEGALATARKALEDVNIGEVVQKALRAARKAIPDAKALGKKIADALKKVPSGEELRRKIKEGLDRAGLKGKTAAPVPPAPPVPPPPGVKP